MSILGVFISFNSGAWWLVGAVCAFFLVVALMPPLTDDVYDREVGPLENELDEQRFRERSRR
jgi:hypothetical protein